MAQNIFRLVLTDEAQDFIESLPEAVSYKIYYNIKRVVGGERNKELWPQGGTGQCVAGHSRRQDLRPAGP